MPTEDRVGSANDGARGQRGAPSMLDRRAMLDSSPDLAAVGAPEASAIRTPEGRGGCPGIVPGEPIVTLCGMPLEAGERVVFFARPRHARQKLVYVIVGVLLAPLVVGFAFIAYGLMYERYNLRFVAITTRRIVVQRGARPPRWLRLPEVVDVRARHAGAQSGTMTEPAAKERAPRKTDPSHWRNAEAVVVQGRAGALSIDESVAPEVLGPAVANAIWTEGYLDSLPEVHHPS
jgi:hypothetical protein